MSAAASAAGISSHRDSLLMLLDVLQKGQGALKFPSVDGLSRLASVLERHPKIGTAGAGRLGGLDLSGGVSDLLQEREGSLAAYRLWDSSWPSATAWMRSLAAVWTVKLSAMTRGATVDSL